MTKHYGHDVLEIAQNRECPVVVKIRTGPSDDSLVPLVDIDTDGTVTVRRAGLKLSAEQAGLILELVKGSVIAVDPIHGTPIQVKPGSLA